MRVQPTTFGENFSGRGGMKTSLSTGPVTPKKVINHQLWMREKSNRSNRQQTLSSAQTLSSPQPAGQMSQLPKSKIAICAGWPRNQTCVSWTDGWTHSTGLSPGACPAQQQAPMAWAQEGMRSYSHWVTRKHLAKRQTERKHSGEELKVFLRMRERRVQQQKRGSRPNVKKLESSRVLWASLSWQTPLLSGRKSTAWSKVQVWSFYSQIFPDGKQRMVKWCLLQYQSVLPSIIIALSKTLKQFSWKHSHH